MTKVATCSFIFVREIYMPFNEKRCWKRWINTLEDQETGFNGDVDDNDEVATCSFIFVRDNFNPFNEETQKKFIGGFIYEKKQSGLCMGT